MIQWVFLSLVSAQLVTTSRCSICLVSCWWPQLQADDLKLVTIGVAGESHDNLPPVHDGQP